MTNITQFPIVTQDATPLIEGLTGAVTKTNALEAEIAEARGARSRLGLRINNISNFASPNSGGNVPGRFYDQSFHAGTAATLAGTANRIYLSPFFTSQALTVDQIGVSVGTGVAGSLARCVIYEASAEGWPLNRVWVGEGTLGCATTGFKFHAQTFTFEPGRQYWVGVHVSSTQTLHAIPTASLTNLGLGSATANGATAYITMVALTVPFADQPPATWTFAASQLVNANMPSIRMRCAA